MVYRENLVGLILWALSFAASAACSGSGLSWSCTSGSTAANVQSAIDSASDGAVVTLATGSYTFSSILSLNNRNGITIKCATIRGCAVTISGGGLAGMDSIPSTRTGLYRISGFVVTGSAGTATIWFYGDNNVQKLRIDNNTFNCGGTGQINILIGTTTNSGRFYGVIDNNIFQGSTNCMGLKSLGGPDTWQTGLQGSANNLFLEDNTFNFTAYNDLGSGGIDAWKSGGIVVRFNSFFNARIVNHSLCHGGPANSEVYNNTINAPDSVAPNYRNIHFQGSGETIAFNNTVYGGHIEVQHFRSSSNVYGGEGDCGTGDACDGSAPAQYIDGNRAGENGYPCWHQPGRDDNGTLKPVYMFKNLTDAGANITPTMESGTYAASHIVQNRDWYSAVSATAQTSPSSPFNGTVGVGHGTLANRPTTCTSNTGPDAGNGGVAYWATDVGNWNGKTGTTQGILYRCSATNTWTAHYTPYKYPHPLRVQGGPAAPTVN